jgi:hypothetical protein
MKMGTLTTSGIKFEEKEKISVFPNPAKDELNINLADLSGKNVVAEIYDVSGRLVKTEPLNGKGIQQINIQMLDKGIYFLKVKSQEKVYSVSFVRE